MSKLRDKSFARNVRIEVRWTETEFQLLRNRQLQIRAPSLAEVIRTATLNSLSCQSSVSQVTDNSEENKEKSPCTSYKENKEGLFLVPNNKVICPDADKSATRQKKVLSLGQRMEAFRLRLVPYLKKYGRDMLNDFFAYWTERSENGKKMRFEMEKVFNVGRRLATWRKRDRERRFTGIQTTPTISPEQLREQTLAKREREAKAQAEYQQRVRDQEASQTPEAQAERDRVFAKFGKPWKRVALS